MFARTSTAALILALIVAAFALATARPSRGAGAETRSGRLQPRDTRAIHARPFGAYRNATGSTARHLRPARCSTCRSEGLARDERRGGLGDSEVIGPLVDGLEEGVHHDGDELRPAAGSHLRERL